MKSKTTQREEADLAYKLADLVCDHGIYLPTRHLFLTEEIGPESVARFLRGLHVLEVQRPDETITVVINSPGGTWYDGIAVFDAIRSSPCPVRGVVRGHAMSMASVIFQACDIRLMSQYSTQLIHYGSAGFDGHSVDFVRAADEERRIAKIEEDIYLHRMQAKAPRKSLDDLRLLLRFDTYLDAQRCIDLGLADDYG